MRASMVGFVSILLFASLFAGGCAKKELVKGEEPVSAGAQQPEAVPGAKPAKPAETVPVQTVKEQPVVREEPRTATAEPTADASLGKIYFDFDSFLLSQAARETLSHNAEYLKKKPALKVQVEGHCDERGSDEYNMALGEKRAQAALNYLVTLGVPADRLSFISYGKEKPEDPGHDEAAWAKNRRVQFTVVQ